MNRISLVNLIFLTVCWLVPMRCVLPDSAGAGDYDAVAENLFWQNLYPYGGWTLYCGYRFEHDRRTQEHGAVIIEHLYPTVNMFKHAGCASRMECRESGNPKFREMEADMHNMYPIWSGLATYRYGQQFGAVPGEQWRFDDCEIEWKSGIVEPRALAKGNIARSILYMHRRYGVEVAPDLLAILKRWNGMDPPSKQERFRNDRIEALQGRRNPFIDNPALADDLSAGD